MHALYFRHSLLNFLDHLGNFFFSSCQKFLRPHPPPPRSTSSLHTIQPSNHLSGCIAADLQPFRFVCLGRGVVYCTVLSWLARNTLSLLPQAVKCQVQTKNHFIFLAYHGLIWAFKGTFSSNNYLFVTGQHYKSGTLYTATFVFIFKFCLVSNKSNITFSLFRFSEMITNLPEFTESC
jgi:hypothetical protein